MIPDVSPELPSRGWRLSLALLGRLPQAALSRGLGHIADLPVPHSLRKPILGRIARALGIDLGEAARPLEAYGSLNELFVRQLKAGARVWPQTADRRVARRLGVWQAGQVEDGTLIQAKFAATGGGSLDGDDRRQAERFPNELPHPVPQPAYYTASIAVQGSSLPRGMSRTRYCREEPL